MLTEVEARQQDERQRLARENAALQASKKRIFDEARSEGLASASASAATEIERARTAAIEDGKAEGRQEARRAANAVRAIPLDKVMSALNGQRDAANGDLWLLPSLGAVRINAEKPHRFRIEKSGNWDGGAISLVMAETGVDCEKAVRFLLTEFRQEDIVADSAFIAARREGAAMVQIIKTIGEVGIEDRAPQAPAMTEAVIEALVAQGIARDLVDAAVKGGNLAATRQGSKILARWSLKSAQGELTGFALSEPGVDGIIGIRGQDGLWSMSASAVARSPAPNGSPQLWIAPSPAQAMAAASACSKLQMAGYAPSSKAELVSMMDAKSATAEAVARMTTAPRAEIILCAPATNDGAMWSDAVKKLFAGKVKVRGFRWILTAVRAKSWTDLAAKMIAGGGQIIAAVKEELIRRGGLKAKQPNHAINDE